MRLKRNAVDSNKRNKMTLWHENYVWNLSFKTTTKKWRYFAGWHGANYHWNRDFTFGNCNWSQCIVQIMKVASTFLFCGTARARTHTRLSHHCNRKSNTNLKMKRDWLSWVAWKQNSISKQNISAFAWNRLWALKMLALSRYTNIAIRAVDNLSWLESEATCWSRVPSFQFSFLRQ